ncbi:MAG: 2-oxo acid dehydrogenase subunit E2 [Thermoleophilia bacterium]|nr:2-oxo acid dehydrogenase subunit E2 [Thermoleophilia bacterium]
MSSSATEQTVDVVMPQMGVSVTEGTIAAWLKQPGEEIAADEPVCEVSTDKIDVEIPAPCAGTLSEILVEEGSTVIVGTVLARIATGPVPAAEAAEPLAADGTAPTTAEGEEELDRSGFYSPVVRRLATEQGIDLAAVAGHGVGGRVRKADVLEYLQRREAETPPNGPGNGSGRSLHTESPYRPDPVPRSGQPAETPAPSTTGNDLLGPTRRESISAMRRAIGEHMLASRGTSAHCTTVLEADFTSVEAEIAARTEQLARRGVPLTYLAFAAHAVVETLAEHPILNASIEADEVVYHEDVNLGIAVAIEEGLLVPVIRKAQRLSVEGLAAAIADLAARARSGALAPDDLVGGTFTITNPGRHGAMIATPIINQPEVGILDLEAVVRRPVVSTDAEGNEAIAIRSMSYLCMSWDHRALDGVEAARFLGGVRDRIEAGARR